MPFSRWFSPNRRPGGEYNSPNFNVPENVRAIRVRLDVNPSDFATPERSVTATVQVSWDNAQSWQDELAISWVGGPVPTRPGVTPGWYATLSGLEQYHGALVRVHFSTSGDFRWGLSGELAEG